MSDFSLPIPTTELLHLSIHVQENLYRRTGFNCVVKSLHFHVLNAYCIFNNCVYAYAYAYCVLIFASIKKKLHSQLLDYNRSYGMLITDLLVKEVRVLLDVVGQEVGL